jgi:hypothetical protein
MTARCSRTKSRPWQCAAKRACICTAYTCLSGLLLVIDGSIQLTEVRVCQDMTTSGVSQA